MKKDLTWLRQNSAELLDDLYNASQRQGSWRELPVEKAFDALKTCITYALGRPAAMKPNEDAPDDGTFDITEAPTEPD
jgi:hypothetical protein